MSQNTEPRILHLVLKYKWFDLIAKGVKKDEYRCIHPKTASRYIVYSNGGEGEIAKPRIYDAIRFYKGYSKDRANILVEVTGAEIIMATEDEGNKLVYKEDGVDYFEADIKYELGKIIENR